MIRAVTFDLDETLFDFQSCMNAGAAAVVAALGERRPAAADRATVTLFHELWREVTEEATKSGAPIDWPRERRRGIERLALRCDCRDAVLVDELTDLYFRLRHAPVLPFEDAAEAVARLSAHLPLGIISNANTTLEQIGLADNFRVVLNPGTSDYRKPAARIFHEAALALGCAPDELLHVGDRWEDDVAGALSAGCQAAWYRRGSEVGGAVRVEADLPDMPRSRPPRYLVVGDLRCLAEWILTQPVPGGDSE